MAESSSSPTVSATKPTDEDLKALSGGQQLLKFCKHSKPHGRLVKIDAQSSQLLWTSSRKKASKTVVNFDDVREVRIGQATKTFKTRPGAAAEALSFSVIYGSEYETLDLVASNEAQYKLWTNAVSYYVQEAAKADKIELFLRQAWRKADKNGDNKLSLNEISHLLRQLNVNVHHEHLKKRFKEVAKDNFLDFAGFSEFYKHLKYRKDVKELFGTLTKTFPKVKLTAEEFKSFLISEQKLDVSDADVKAIITKYGKDQYADDGALSLEGFSEYLNGQDTNALNPLHATIYQNMDLPLNYYYINSSHNTYLMKDQLRGPSSVEAYVHALSKGCRCVELDCWDGSDGDPIIYHGHTLTSRIKFRDAIKAINEYAFKASPYPVILSLEVHCHLEQQGVMAKIMKEIFGDKLHVVPIASVESKLPSPNQLKNKILIKGKAVPPEVKHDEYESDEEGDDEEEEDNDPTAAEAKKLKAANGHAKGGKVKVHKDLSDLVNCTKSGHFKGFDQIKGKPNEIFSFVETKSSKFGHKHAEEYKELNSKSMTRIYPKGSRIDSSNYDPTEHWEHGSHVVALNYQTYDRPLQLNLGKFEDNGNCGYLVKAPTATKYDPAIYQQAALPPKKLTIQIISASQLPKPLRQSKGEIIDPYIEVEIAGAKADHAHHKTKTVNDNGFNPHFGEAFTFNVTVPELALLRLVVMDKDVDNDDFIATHTVPITSLQEGYRHVTLFDYQHHEIPLAAIYVHVKFD